MFQEEGASMLRTGIMVFSRAEITGGKGARMGGVKENPKRASRMWSGGDGELRVEMKSSVKGMFRLRSCMARRV